MHGGYAEGLFSFVTVILIGAGCCIVQFISIAASRRHSFSGFKGATLFLLIAILLLSMAAAVDNLLWDLLGSRNDAVNILVCCGLSYLVPMPLMRKLFLVENRHLLNSALWSCCAILATLAIGWFIAETFACYSGELGASAN